MNPNYIIVQAGGKGSRMEALTRNKPKALVPVNNLPIIFHLFRKFPDKRFLIIGDYKYDVLDRYLRTFAKVDYKLLSAGEKKGTCAGIAQALGFIPRKEAFLLIWSDLILPDDYEFPKESGNYVGIATDFICRWSYRLGKFTEEKSKGHGVAGHFLFTDKSILENVPGDGEFVAWLSRQNIAFQEQFLTKTKEYGIYSDWKKIPKMKCRPFNSVEVCNGKFIKRAICEQGEEIARHEIQWYQTIQSFDGYGGGINSARFFIQPSNFGICGRKERVCVWQRSGWAEKSNTGKDCPVFKTAAQPWACAF